MSKNLQQFHTEYGNFWIEVEAEAETQDVGVTSGLSDISVSEGTEKKSKFDFNIIQDFDGSVFSIMPMIQKIRDMTKSVDLKEVEVEVGAKFAKKINVFVISGGADVDFKIKFRWNIGEAPSSQQVKKPQP